MSYRTEARGIVEFLSGNWRCQVRFFAEGAGGNDVYVADFGKSF